MEGTTIALLCMNKPRVLKETVLALQQTLVHPYEVIVVDNHSTDPQTLALLDELDRLEDWTVVRNQENKGLSVGTNQGLELGKYDCLIHMDDDCLITQHGWNQIMRSYFDIPEVGMVVPHQTGESIRHEKYQELRWALGMCWAIRKSLFDDIGGYDPQLIHQNECDMALRARMAGYRLAGIGDFRAIHNDPGGPQSDIAAARVHLGCVQFRDKWTSYFRGRDWDYGTQPIYLMQHWPPDQEFMRKFVRQEGYDLNTIEESIHLQGFDYYIHKEARIDRYHLDWNRIEDDGFSIDREKAIARWHELTGELYTGYKWRFNLLRPYT